MRESPLSRVCLLLLGLAAAVSVHGTLTYPTRADAVGAATAYIQADSGLRLALSGGATGAAALSPAAMDALLVDRLHLIQPAALKTPWIDARRLHLPAATDSTPQRPLLTYTNTTGTADATALQATVNVATNSVSPPQEMSELKLSVLVYAALLSDNRLCPDVSEVPVEDLTTGKVTCGCADGRICALTASAATVTSVVGVDSLPSTTAIVGFVVEGVLVLPALIAVVVMFRRRASIQTI